MSEFIIPASALLFTFENIIWINLGVFIGAVFACIPGLSVILCVILFLPLTYQLTAIPGMMFLLGIYCAGSYGGSVSAILINTPGTPHAAATMLDGHPLSKKGRSRVALKIALYASTIGGTISAFMLLFLGPQVAKVAAQLGTAEYFMVCVFGLTIIAGVSGKSIIKGIISACIGLVISCIGSDPMTGYDRLTFNVDRLYLGLDLAICLIGLFALIEIIAKADGTIQQLKLSERKKLDDGVITKDEKKRMVRPILMSSFIGCMVGIIPGTGAAEASWFSYNQAKNMSKHKEEFGHGSVEGIAAAESANNAVTGATLIPLLTLGIPGDGTVAIMLSALMINGLNPGLSLFTTDGDIMYAIMLGLILVNIFMLIQGRYLTQLFAKVVAVPQEILTPIIVIFCYAGAYSINKNYFDVSVALYFGIAAWLLRKLDLPAIPILLGLVLGNMTETNFRRALMLSDGNISIFFSSVYCWIFIALIVLALAAIIKGKISEERKMRALNKEMEAEAAAEAQTGVATAASAAAAATATATATVAANADAAADVAGSDEADAASADNTSSAEAQDVADSDKSGK
ncbi:tripartite tricarboxylate transporter permease [uncultured Anaerobiospirillum sp.]|uniref:tripartite tricarboxylate transporter permease n=1 Tax=uncultured Anaerobiospirillum sp. TaxID=265728 RepID=UPI0028043821|nr:tripartite tricarboxylate transporter permease [uncultured Anaerobiospirillum sp.]